MKFLSPPWTRDRMWLFLFRREEIFISCLTFFGGLFLCVKSFRLFVSRSLSFSDFLTLDPIIPVVSRSEKEIEYKVYSIIFLLLYSSPRKGEGDTMTLSCKNIVSEKSLDIFHQPARIIIAGQSNSGKSYITTQLIRENFHKFDRIVISGADKSTFDLPEDILRKILFYDDLVNPFEEILFEGCKLFYIIEDMYLEALNDKNIALAFTRGRHKGVNILITTQVLFPRNAKYARDIGLNTSHYFLTKIRDLSQVEVLARQIFGRAKSKNFLKAYQTALSNFSHGHILIDTQCSTPPELQVRSNLFKIQYPFEIVYEI